MGHGVKVNELATVIKSPKIAEAGIQLVIGTAPIHLVEDPQAVVNVPVMCKDLNEAKKKLGYSKKEMEKFTLCQSMFWNFEIFRTSPVIFVNVLDPEKHAKVFSQEVTVSKSQIVVPEKNVLRESVKVSNSGTDLKEGVDFITSFDEDGQLLIVFLKEMSGTLSVSGKKLDPDMVTYEDVIGGYDVLTGKESGIQLIRRIYPMFGITAATIIAPGYSHIPEVAAALQAVCESINGVFSAECILDLDSDKCKRIDQVEKAKEDAGFNSIHAYVVWPMVQRDGMILYGSANAAASAQATDSKNGNIPNVSPSNKAAYISGAVLKDGTEVFLDFAQAELVNEAGVATYLNNQGWKLWGNYTAAYPNTNDPKDKFFPIRRFFSWHGNRFIKDYLVHCDDPANPKLIDTIVDEENMVCNGYVSAGVCAGAGIELNKEKNTTDSLISGKLYFKQKLTPYPPAQEIINDLMYDPEALYNELGGGSDA